MTQFIQALTIAGHDSDGSAGMPADLHAFYADGVYGHGILVSAVAGNSKGIFASQIMSADFIQKQFEVLADDFDIKASKTGMLGTQEVINVVADHYDKELFGPLVVDPVIITKHGAMLLDEDAYQLFRERIIPLADVITPNFFEAQKLAEMDLKTKEDTIQAAKKLHDLGAKNVVIKGPHKEGWKGPVSDYVSLESGEKFWMDEEYIETEHINGTGDAFSAIIAAEIAKGTKLSEGVRIAKKFVHAAIEDTIDVGHRFGPINHWAGQKRIENN